MGDLLLFIIFQSSSCSQSHACLCPSIPSEVVELMLLRRMARLWCIM